MNDLQGSDTQADDDDDGYATKRNALGPEFDHIHNKCDKGTLSSSLVVWLSTNTYATIIIIILLYY